MTDLISRQAVIDRINKQREHLRPYRSIQDEIGDAAYRICAEFIERIPSAPLYTPDEIQTMQDMEWSQMEKMYELGKEERKKGKWIADVDRWGDVETTVNGYICSECKVFNTDKDNYCPNCGADMREGEQSEIDRCG